MKKKRIVNMAASVRARLLKRARAEGRPCDELLQYFAMERFLYRLSRSAYADRFVLKGALMLQFWGGPLSRSTRDIDLLGIATMGIEEIVKIVRDVLTVNVEDDGLLFDPDRVTGEAIRLDAYYDGVRTRSRARLGSARIVLQVDVGFGDVVTPGVQLVVYPSLLDFDAPRLFGYTPESTVAEKFQAMVVLDMANTRMKDFFDIWLLARGQTFRGDVLAEAIEATFQRRRTPLPDSVPVALSPAFHSAPAKGAQWHAYALKARVHGPVPRLDEVTGLIAAFLMPVVDALRQGMSFDRHWPAGGPWEALSGTGEGDDRRHA